MWKENLEEIRNSISDAISDFKFPEKLYFRYGKEGEWYEWWHRKRGIVVQKFEENWQIFFLNGEIVRIPTFKVGKNVDRVVAFRNLESVKEFLSELLGTKIEFENKNQKGGKK